MTSLVQFPNSHGFDAADPQAIAQAQAQFGFSDALRDFLMMQNGFEADGASADDWPCVDPIDADNIESCARVRYLFGVDAPEDYTNLVSQARALDMFAGVFMPIGDDHGGNPLVEVLAGERKGWIGSLDHDLFASSEDFDGLASALDLNCSADDTAQVKAQALCDLALGLVWWHAQSLAEFTARCLHIDDDGNCFVLDTEGAVSLNAA